VGVYKANTDNHQIRSISDRTPKVSTTGTAWRNWRTQRGTGWRLIDYRMHRDIANLFPVFVTFFRLLFNGLNSSRL